MSEIRVVNRGEDTLIVTLSSVENDRPIRRDLNETLVSHLDTWKKRAQELGEPF